MATDGIFASSIFRFLVASLLVLNGVPKTKSGLHHLGNQRQCGIGYNCGWRPSLHIVYVDELEPRCLKALNHELREPFQEFVAEAAIALGLPPQAFPI